MGFDSSVYYKFKPEKIGKLIYISLSSSVLFVYLVAW